MPYGIISQAKPPETGSVSVQYDLIFSLRNQETVIRERFRRAKVEHKNQVFTHISQYLIAIIIPNLLDRGILEILHIPDQFQHLTVEIAQEMVLQIQVVHQIPLTASVFIRPSIALPWEVDPFRMPKLISHEVQITAINGRSRNQTDHLMQGDTSIYHEIMVIFLHMPIHIGVDQAEDDRLITHQGLIVARRFVVSHQIEDGCQSSSFFSLIVLIQ